MGELERMTRRYTAELIEFIGPEKDVPAPDVNTNEQTMAWIMDTYSMHMRQTVTAVVTGKPINIGGSRGRREATGRGVMIVCDEACKKLGIDAAKPPRVIVQGFGNVGSNAAKLMREAGYKIIGIAEVRRRSVQQERHRHRKLWSNTAEERHHPRLPRRGEMPTRDELLTTECEILIPAATENVITSRNADRVKCRILAEGANGPTTSAADEILSRQGRLRHSRHSGQRRRRHHLVFRVGAGPPGIFLERVGGQRATGDDHGQSSFDDVVQLRRNAQCQQPHRRLHAGDRSRAYTIRQRGIYA